MKWFTFFSSKKDEMLVDLLFNSLSVKLVGLYDSEFPEDISDFDPFLTLSYVLNDFFNCFLKFFPLLL